VLNGGPSNDPRLAFGDRLGQPYPPNFYSFRSLALLCLRIRFACTPSKNRQLPLNKVTRLGDRFLGHP
jgi:hypothetical protein